MEKKDFMRLENMCQTRFTEAGNCFHICSQENHPVIFHNKLECTAAMNIMAYVAIMFQDIRIYTFEIMDNHIHILASGDRSRIEQFLHTLVMKMAAIPELKASSSDIKRLIFKIILVESLDNFRNVIAYINRNGFVVSADYSPFSYPWGANRYFFNEEAKLRFQESGQIATYRQKRHMFHSDLISELKDIIILDGYVSPMNYCHISDAESVYRSSRHYFQSVSRNIESAKDIAKTIGESIFYSDEDLFSYVASLCSKQYRKPSIQLLSKDEKTEIARVLHYDYNAGNKQISRILKLEIEIVNQLFP